MEPLEAMILPWAQGVVSSNLAAPTNSLSENKRLAVERIVRGVQKTGNVVGVRMSLVDEDSLEDPWLPGLSSIPPSRARAEPRLPYRRVAGGLGSVRYPFSGFP